MALHRPIRRRRHRLSGAILLCLLLCQVLRLVSEPADKISENQRNNFVSSWSSWPWTHGRQWLKTPRHCKEVDPLELLSQAEVRQTHAAVRAKCLDAIAAGNLPPGRELELISALDLGTVPWSLVPIKLKKQLGLPLQDMGIDSLALNLSVAVQAKDYPNGRSTVPLNRLTNFYFMVRSEGSPLRNLVKQLVVATNSSTTLPQHWQWSEAVHRQYTAEELVAWRMKARAQEEAVVVSKKTLKRWPHQVECLKKCRKFLQSRKKRNFFVQMATGTGKSLVMADLLAGLRACKRSCVIVPKLDLMEQLAQLLEETLAAPVARVGTGHPADFSAEVFVCVRNSAWQLANLTLDLLILDEAHHYEPEPNANVTPDVGVDNPTAGVHAWQVLSLNASKRIFFSATLLKNKPDFDFGLRPAIEAGIIKDYALGVPVLSEGDPRPGLIEVIQNLPLSRKILAFCNTVCEAKRFTKMLCDTGIPADHYNALTSTLQRKEILKNFQRSEGHGGLRVLVTVDVLSEGVDLPVADTCLFVAPRQGVRLQQCVGRVLRNHSGKVDALVIAPPVVQHSNGTLVEDEALVRLLRELARADRLFKTSIGAGNLTHNHPVGVLQGSSADLQGQELEEVASLLRVRIFRAVLELVRDRNPWEESFQELQAYKTEHGNVLVKQSHRTKDGYRLGIWVHSQRVAWQQGRLNPEKKHRLDQIGFVWCVHDKAKVWEETFQELQAYRAEHGHVLVPRKHRTENGCRLGIWVNTQRRAWQRGRLNPDRKHRLDQIGFVWRVHDNAKVWEESFPKLQAYRAEHGNVLVPQGHRTKDGYRLGMWVHSQRSDWHKGRLNPERKHRLDQIGFVWRVRDKAKVWEETFQELQAYRAEHGNVLVPQGHRTKHGYGLGLWVSRQRVAWHQGRLNPEKKHRLDQIGFVWRVHDNAKVWEETFQKLQAYRAEHGNVLVPRKHRTENGCRLGMWVHSQRSDWHKGRLNPERKHRLDQIGFVWRVRDKAKVWEETFQKLQAYRAEHGNVLVEKEGDSFLISGFGYLMASARKDTCYRSMSAAGSAP
eukprot:Skav201917  [mRNA]  locus=scaffold3992:189213:192371:+ [translate_table: standard]